MKKYKVIWDTYAKESLKSITEYIKEGSPSAAKKVKNELLRTARSLHDKPSRFSQEPYLQGREGDYRSVSKWYFKIIYKVTESEVHILDVFHSKKSPSKIEELD